MYFEVLQSLSLNGSMTKPNDDRMGATRSRAWVVDGATDLGEPGLLGNQGGAAWLASAASLGFSTATGADLRATCTQMFTFVAELFEADRTRKVTAAWELPKAAFAVAQLVEARLEVARLEVAWAADCPILLMPQKGGTFWCTGAPDSSTEAADAKALGIGLDKAPLISGDILEDRRAQRMQADHAALSPDPEAAAKITHFSSQTVEAGDELLIMSDGFSALVSDYGRYDADGLAQELRKRGLAALAEEIREIERNDPRCTRYPRFKVSDDATAVWLRIAP